MPRTLLRALAAPVALTVPVMLTIAGCVAPPSAPPAVVRTRAAPPPAVPRALPTDVTLTPGTWTYASDARGSVARYGLAGGDARLVVRCDHDRRIFLSLPGTQAGPLVLRASTSTKSFSAAATGGTPAAVVIELAAADPILDALAFSRGRFSVDYAGSTTVLPPWPEFARVVEDCRG